jgi:hypothetical protein
MIEWQREEDNLMCYCQPELKTPYCGRPECVSPGERPAPTPNPEPASLDAWNAVAEAGATPLDLASFDALVVEYKAAREDYDAKKKISNEANAKVEALKAKVIATLKASKKSKYHVEGLGTVYMIAKKQVSMPQGLDEKRALFRHFQEKGVHLEFLTIHHGTLNSYLNQELEKDPAFKLPGVADPTVEETLGFRKG